MFSHLAQSFGRRGRRLASAVALTGTAGAVFGLGWAHAQSGAVAGADDDEREPTPFQKSLTRGVGVACYNANYPVEDRGLLVDGHDRGASSDRFRIFGVFDGHGGWQVADFASSNFLSAWSLEMQMARGKTGPSGRWGSRRRKRDLNGSGSALLVGEDQDDDVTESERSLRVRRALTRAFERLDREWSAIVSQAFRAGFGQVGRVGSCALVVVVDEDEGAVFTAQAGDSMAVLGRKETTEGGGSTGGTRVEDDPSVKGVYDVLPAGQGAAGKEGYTAHTLCNEHNARLPAQIARLKLAHPGEDETIVRCKRNNPDACYVKGRLQPTRALGDLYLKYSEFNGPPYSGIYDNHRGRHIKAPYTPPYITATPEVQRHELPLLSSSSSFGSFIVIASDGLWDVMSSQQAVDIAARALRESEAAARGGLAPAGDEEEDGEASLQYAYRHAADAGGGGMIVGLGGPQGGGKVATAAAAAARRRRRGDADIHASAAAQCLVTEALRRAAAQNGMSVEKLRQLPRGPKRRRVHDDLTVFVVTL